MDIKALVEQQKDYIISIGQFIQGVDIHGNFAPLIFGECCAAFVDGQSQLVQCHSAALPELPDLVPDLNTNLRHIHPSTENRILSDSNIT